MSLDEAGRPTVREPQGDDRDRATIRETGGAARDRATRREGGPTETGRPGSRRTYNLPAAILEKYEYLGDVEGATGGSGAALVLCRELADDTEVVIKWYRGGESLADQRIMDVVGTADAQHVVPTRFEHSDGELWEVQEYFPLGTLETVRRENSGRPVADDYVRAVLAELTEAIDYLHSIGVVHRDLKPANVFVRQPAPALDLVVGDFNTSIQAQETVLASVRATWAYAPPEAGSTEVSARGDWWPVGIMLFELLVGRHPLADPATGLLPNENTIRDRVFQNDIDLSAVADARWSLLLGGLLTWSEHDRWTAKQVREWQAGGSPSVARGGPRTTASPTRVLAGIQPFVFQDVAYTDAATLTTALIRSWDAAVTQLAGRGTERLHDFLASAGFDKATIGKLVDDSSPALTLIALQDAFLDGVPEFEGRSLAQESLSETARQAVGGDAAASAWITHLRARGILRALSRYLDDDGAVARAGQRLDDWWYDIDARVERLGLDSDAQAAVTASRVRMEGQLLFAAFDDTAAKSLRSEAIDVAKRRDDVIGWAEPLRSATREIDVAAIADTSRAALGLALLPAARSLELGRLEGVRQQDAAARRAAHATLLRTRRGRSATAFWGRLRVVFGYAVIAGLASSIELDGPNVVRWWMWPELWGAVATAGISTLALALIVFLVETYISPLRLGARREFFVAGILVSILLLWNQLFPTYGYFAIPPSAWLVPPVTMLIAFVVALVVNAIAGYRQTPEQEIAGGTPWTARPDQRYVRVLTGFAWVPLALVLLVTAGFAVEMAVGMSAASIVTPGAPPWVTEAVRTVYGLLPGDPWFSPGASGLTFTMAAGVCTLVVVGLQRDIARRVPVVGALLLVALSIANVAIVLSAPWELALAVIYAGAIIVGLVILGIIIAIIGALV